MADDEFVIGFSDSEWTGIAPILEEDVAMSSLAQDELGHAAALYDLLAELTGSDRDVIAYDREPADYRHARLLDHGRGDWAMTIARRYLYETSDAVRLEALAGGSWAPLAELVGKIRREERYHVMHITTWLRATGRRRRRGARAADRRARHARSGRRHGLHATPRGGGTRRGGDPRRARWPTSRRAGGRPSPRPSRAWACRRSRRRATRDRGRADHGADFAWLHGEFTVRPTQRPGSDLVSEYGTHVAIARARAGLTDPTPGDDAGAPAPSAAIPAPLDVALVRSILATIPDPELPILSIVDLGMVDRVEVEPTAIHVTLLPTFVGCPAIDLIRATVGEALAAAGTDRRRSRRASIRRGPRSGSARPAGRALAAAGIAPPSDPSLVRCPLCESPRVVMDSVFGPTQCRSLFYCRDCRQPFEAMKPV